MLLTIHNLPVHTRYSDVKALIESHCGLSDVLLDHLVKDGQYKKVTVGVVEEEDAAILVRKINGLYVQGAQLYVEDIRQKKKSSEQPYRPMASLSSNRDKDDSSQQPGVQSLYAQANFANPMNMQFSNMANYQYMVPEMMNMMMNQQMMGMGMYVLPQQKNAFMDNSGHVIATPSTSNYTLNNPVQNMRGRNINPQRKGGGDADRDRNSHQGKQSRWGPKSNEPQDKKTKRSNNWNIGEIGATGRRSRSPYTIDSGDNGAYNSRYRHSPDRFDDSDYHRKASNVFCDRSDPHYDSRDDQQSESYKDCEVKMDNFKSPYYQRNESLQRQDFFESRDRLLSDSNQHRESRKRPNPYSFCDNALDRTWGESLSLASYKNRNENQCVPPQKIQRIPQLMSQKIDPFVKKTGNSSAQDNLSVGVNPSGRENTAMRGNPSGRGNPLASDDRSGGFNLAMRVNLPSGEDSPSRGNPLGKAISARGNLSGSGNRPVRANPSIRGNLAVRGNLTERGNPAIRGNPSGRGNSAVRGNLSSRGNPSVRGQPSGRGNPAIRGQPSGRGTQAVSGNASGGNSGPKGFPPPKNKPLDYDAMIRRDTAWRQFAVSQISKPIFAEYYKAQAVRGNEGKSLLKAIKKAIHTRIDLILRGELAVPAPIIIEKYRKRFPATGDSVFLAALIKNLSTEDTTIKQEKHGTKDDQRELVQQVKDNEPLKKEESSAMPVPKVENLKQDTKVEKLLKAEPAEQIKAIDIEVNKMAVTKIVEVNKMPIPKKVKVNKKPVPKTKKQTPPAPIPVTGKLPNYPEGDKKVHQQMRKMRKLEVENEDLYNLEPTLAGTIEKELDGLTDTILRELSNPSDKSEESTLQRLRVEPVIIIRKSIKMTLIKRLLDIRTSLAIMIFIEGKIPSPANLSEFLRPYRIISLKKSQPKQKKKRPSFVATCEDYQAFDYICSLRSVVMNESTALKFSPLHCTPKKPNITSEEIKKHIAERLKPKQVVNEDVTTSFDFNTDSEIFYVDIPDVQGVKNEGSGVDIKNVTVRKDNTESVRLINDDIKDDDDSNDDATKGATNNDVVTKSDTNNDFITKCDTNNDVVTDSDTNNDFATKEDTNNYVATKSDTNNDFVTQEDTNNDVVTENDENNDLFTKDVTNNGVVIESYTNNDGFDTNDIIKNDDDETNKANEVTAADDEAAFAENVIGDDREDYFMMDGEEYRIEDEVTEIRDADLEDY